jgi:hypothetical protein
MQTLMTPDRTTAAELDRLRAIAGMVAGLAHDIDTPLGIVKQAAEIVDRELSSTHADLDDVGSRRRSCCYVPVHVDLGRVCAQKVADSAAAFDAPRYCPYWGSLQ